MSLLLSMTDPDHKPDTLLALEEAIAVAGGQTALARKVGKSQGHVSQWLLRHRCAADVALAVERETGISRHRLRPDVFGSAESEARAAEAGDGRKAPAPRGPAGEAPAPESVA